MAWVPVESYVEHELKVDLSKESCLFGDWGPTTLEHILNEQYNVEYHNKRGYKGLCSICVIIKVCAYLSDLMRHNANILSQLLLRGRRLFLSTFVSSQGL